MFETAVVNEPSVFEPLKFYCIRLILQFDIYLYNNATMKKRAMATVHYFWISPCNLLCMSLLIIICAKQQSTKTLIN